MVQAFLPLLRRNAPGSRIANYSSGAIIANPVGAGVYNMSKHAIHGMTLTLRHELAPFGIPIIEMCYGDTGLLLSMPRQGLGNSAIAAVANDEQLERFKGTWAAMAITEPGCGSDSAAIHYDCNPKMVMIIFSMGRKFS